MDKLISQRADGLGHWPAGKTRSTLSEVERARVVGKVRKAALTLRSVRAVARLLDVSDSTVRRLLSGDAQPTERIQKLVDSKL